MRAGGRCARQRGESGAQALTTRTDNTSATGQGLVTNEVRSVNAAAQLTGGGQSSSQNRQIGTFITVELSRATAGTAFFSSMTIVEDEL